MTAPEHPSPTDRTLDPYRRVIVDGLNALGSRPDGWWRDRPRAMAGLVGRLQILAQARPQLRIEVVFDGRPHAAVQAAADAGTVEVGFASGGRNAADREISARVRADPDPARILVVSSDRRLAAAVKAGGGATVGAGGFVRDWLSEG